MLDQLSSISSDDSLIILFCSTFIVGLMGSLHCLGMCGPLCLAISQRKYSSLFYQLGRLLSYLSLIFVGGQVFKLIDYSPSNKTLTIVSTLTISVLFIYYGVQTIRKKKSGPKLMMSISTKLGGKAISVKNDYLRASFTGLISILLPCGFLYSVLIILIAFGDQSKSLIGLIGFWLGTLPAMIFSPVLIKKILSPLSKRFPNKMGFSLIIIGVITITYRFFILYNHSVGESCH